MGKTDSLNRPKRLIRKQKAKQQLKSTKNSIFSAVWDYLKSDSYMYGPLLSNKWPTPGPSYASGADRKKRSNSNSPARILKDFFSSPGHLLKGNDRPIQKVIDQLEEASETGGQAVQGSYVSVCKTITTTTIRSDKEQGDQPHGRVGGHAQDPATPSKSVDVRGETEFTEHDGDADEDHSWGHDSHEDEDDFHDHIPLDAEEAEKVANQLIGSKGGRFSDDLGINVDASDNEVESWFLASNLFGRAVSFDVSKKTYKELSEAGVSKTADLLNIDESELATILDGTGYTKYGKRVASQLKKLAVHLEENNWGRVSTFKHTSDDQELVRQLRATGVKLGAARIFLRELRGVWIGVPYEFDMKTKRAAMHLKLLGSIKASSHPERVLSEFAQSAGIDLRDLEVALYKLGSEHEHHYEECPGATSCQALLPAEKLVDSLSSDMLL